MIDEVWRWATKTNGIVVSFDAKHVLWKLVLDMMSFLNVNIIPYHVCAPDFTIEHTEAETSWLYTFDPEIDEVKYRAVRQEVPKSPFTGECCD